MIATTITLIEVDNQFWITVTIDGLDKRYGPYFTADEAEAMAGQIAGTCRVLFHSGTVVPARHGGLRRRA